MVMCNHVAAMFDRAVGLAVLVSLLCVAAELSRLERRSLHFYVELEKIKLNDKF